ncbi:ankyrin repeat domain-containing protein [Streptomyces sp. NPDC012888]|uniref:ankyrin repeat domain-containing protein n=1 Tax=Streptomyces sp. NPDC012888 TaxID=3364855 RepID=UPI0036BA258B
MTYASLPGGLPPSDVPVWLRVRRYAVPRWMIERATAHRLAGDWRAACAAAAVDPVFDLDAIRGEFGAATAEAVAGDLRHLAPDLLRWHMPRLLGGRTTLDTYRRIVLARYACDPAPAEPLTLYATTSPMTEGPQRITLYCAPFGADPFRTAPQDWSGARHLWDARHAGELRDRHARGADRLPFFRADGTPLPPEAYPGEDPGATDPAARAEWAAVLLAKGESALACAAAGLELDATENGDTPAYLRIDPAKVLAAAGLDLAGLAAETRRLAAAGAGDRFRIAVHWRFHLLLLADGPDASAPLRAAFADRDEVADVPFLPEHAWRPDPDLHLVRAGRLTPGELHPLVAAALFPQAGPAAGPRPPAAPAPLRVRCRGEWHEVRFRDGELDMPHTPQERQREQALRAFGGAVAGCFAVGQTVRTGEGRLPRALREQQRELALRAQHGDTPGVLALLDAGVDPRMLLPNGRSLLHLLQLLDHEPLLPRLLAAGLELEAQDKTDRTPLMSAVTYGGSPELVRALLDAGARIDVVDNMDMSLAQVIRRYARTDLGFLRERVLEEFPGIGSDWWDEWMDEQEEYASDEEDA